MPDSDSFFRYMKFFAVENLMKTPPLVTALPGNHSKSTSRKPILFEKSATYFDNDAVPRRAHALLPRTKLVSLY